MATAHLRTKSGSKGPSYYVEFYDATRTPPRRWISLRTRDKRAAELAFADWVRDEATGRRDPWGDASGASPGRVALSDLVARFLASLEGRAAPNTINQRRVALGHLMRTAGPRTLAASVNADLVAATIASLASRGGAPGSAAPTTRRGTFAAVYVLFSWAVKQGLVPRHPLKGHEAPPGEAAPFYLFTPGEVASVCAAGREFRSRTSTFEGYGYVADAAELAVASGLRIGEIVQLTWADVRTGAGGTASLGVVHDPRRGRTTKTRRSRTASVYPLGVQALARLRQHAEAALGRAVRKGDPVVVNPRGHALDISSLTLRFRRCADLAGLHEATFHDLRHAYISWSVNELGVPLTVVQALAGHQDIKRTASYQRVSPSTAADAVRRALVLAGVATPEPPGGDSQGAFEDVARYLAGLPIVGTPEPPSSTHPLQSPAI